MAAGQWLPRFPFYPSSACFSSFFAERIREQNNTFGATMKIIKKDASKERKEIPNCQESIFASLLQLKQEINRHDNNTKDA